LDESTRLGEPISQSTNMMTYIHLSCPDDFYAV
jgi:hypothetical protein